MDGFPSGQRGQTVNLLQIASVVRIHLHPLHAGVAELADAQDLKSHTYIPHNIVQTPDFTGFPENQKILICSSIGNIPPNIREKPSD